MVNQVKNIKFFLYAFLYTYLQLCDVSKSGIDLVSFEGAVV